MERDPPRVPGFPEEKCALCGRRTNNGIYVETAPQEEPSRRLNPLIVDSVARALAKLDDLPITGEQWWGGKQRDYQAKATYVLETILRAEHRYGVDNWRD